MKARIIYDEDHRVWFVQTRFLFLFWKTVMLTPKKKRAFGTKWLAQMYLELVLMNDCSNLSIHE